MEEDQQFCLRWNNHQSTLISVFDTLLENGTLVDCTLAAEGKFLKAHKVVLSACSPYFATLLSEQYDKHPIFILKDVKYQELRAMMDYMYRGEVNISQDQLAALLKAAESLQIKGLSDNRGGAGSGGVGAACGGKAGEPQKHSTGHVPGKLTNIGHIGAGYTLEQHKRARIGPSSIDSQDIGGSREGSSSPTSRRRKKIRRRSVDQVMGDNHENSNSSQNMQINSSVTGPGAITTSIVPSGAVAQAASGNQIQTQTNKKTDILSKLDQGVSVSTINPASATAAPVGSAAGSGTVSEHEHEHDEGSSNKKEHHHNLQSAIKKDKEVGGGGVASSAASSSDIVIEPKSEYDDGNEETVEDLTLDDEIALDELDQTAGPSHGGEGSSQGYAQWQVDRSHDESYMAQDVQQRDPQELIKCEQGMVIGAAEIKSDRFPCQVCGKSYLRKRHLQRHMRDECIGIPPRFSCELCPSKFRRKYHMVRHIQSKHSGTPQALQLAAVKEELNATNLSTSNVENYENDMAAAAALASFSNGSANGGGSTSGSISGNDSPNMFNDFRTYAGTMAAALYPTSDSPGQAMMGGIVVKDEPISPGKAAQKMEDDWKMKLSLQLISNSLLKERLMNAMPFAYNKH